MKTYLEYKDEKSHKFWQIEVSKNTFTVTYGKVGTNGQSKTKEFDTAEKATSEAEKIIKQKLKKGYKEVAIPIEKPKKKPQEEKIEPENSEVKTSKSGEIDYYAELVKFDNKYGGENFAKGFWIVDDEADFFEDWLYDVSDEQIKEYSQSVQVFASADGTGARYAFWFTDGNTDKNKAPIICYGSEGQIDLVAENIKDLIKMLSYGCEVMDGTFYHGIYEEDYEDYDNYLAYMLTYRPHFLTFREWMKETLGIKPVSIKNLKNNKGGESKKIEKLHKKALKKYKKAFDKWQHQFYPSDEELNKAHYDKKQTIYEQTKAELLDEIAKKPTGDLYLKLAENETILEEINHEQMLSYFEKGLEIAPNHIDLLIKYTKKLTFSSPERAAELYTKLIQIHPEPKKFYSDIAFVYKQNNDLEKALKYYQKDIISNPDSYGTYSQDYLVEICKKLKKKAIPILEETLKEGTNKGTYKVLYKQYFKKENYEKALENVLKYIKHSDEQAHNYTDIADRFFKKERYEAAAQIYSKSLERETWDDRKMRLYNNIGLCYFRIKPMHIDKALEAFKNAYKIDNNEVAMHANIQLCGMHYFVQKEYDKATATLKFCLANFDYETQKTKKVVNALEKLADKGL